ncbi:DEAD/DEAH box helicase [Nostoc sp. C052]|uniref:DEAD/DEAH box helicase n=1 Tax=Nostoc sp. C052 TaxID=2576902 RepID=UPI0015C30ED7|nr:DEAD/DEAH box helicase [Nostoc sp. C052]QLE40705.1 DEAD/DEAH box helicase [Nostoc sp. C052]
MIAEAHKKASVPHIKPVDIPQIIEILQDYDDPFSSEWVNSLRVLWLEKVDINYERCDLISYICGKHPVKNPTWISPEKPHEEYTAGRRLEAVEIHLHEVENLVTTVYNQPAIVTPSVNISTQTVQEPDDSEVEKANSDVIVEGEVLQNEMTQPSNEVIALAKELQNNLAGSRLTPAIAKLYSQHTRLRAGGKGLTGWREDEAGERLNDAMRLVEAAFIQREVGDTNWRNGMLRAGELFEWLSHPQLNPDFLPIRLLAAAVYELAGYPARAAGLLNEDISEGVESEILRSLLKADFPNLLQQLTEYWATATSSNFQTETSLLWDDADTGADRFNKLIVKETASSLGILCAKMRWGNEPRLERAIEKLSDIAKVLLHGHDTYSWLLGKLCAEVTSVYIQTSLRHHLELLSQMITPNGRNFLERYLRQSYQKCKALAWRSQICGIERLVTAESFALCTPTGSGKTTIAEIAILQSLFFETTNSKSLSNSAPLVIYLVPSRALATEVESSLSRVLKRSTNNNVIVTGLYGGTDWGPTDVWLTSEQPTVLICTYEKAEALMKFLGTLFIRRVSLIVLDEAHTVQFDGNKNSLQKAENRALRLESLGARLFTYVEQNHSRIVALSAVASETEVALASWIENQTNASPAKTYYRSTRQLIGRLECLTGRGFRINYDLLDGRRLRFEEDGQATPFIQSPFLTYPPAGTLETHKSSGKRVRPYLFWTAPLSYNNKLSEAESSAIETLDSLDSILLSAIVEIEHLTAKDLSPNELEEQLQKIWRRSFAYYASFEQERLENLFIKRGRALKTEIYSNYSQRRRLYRTSLPPRAGNELLTIYPRLKEQLALGGNYAIWTVEKRFNYIQNIVIILTSLSKFKLDDTSGNVTWNEILGWWLDPNKAIKKPKPTQISRWHSYISQNFGYRFNWGLGSVIALAIDEAFGGELVESSLENWSQIGLPWIVFWMKELIVWGTLDPVAAYLLAKVEDVTTRKQAEELAQTYYQYIRERESEPNEYLNAVNIKNWVEQSFSSVERHLPTPKPANQINVNLLKDFSKALSKNWRVVTVEIGDDIQWFDLAGFPLAICQKPEKWQSNFLNTYDFMLDAENRFVSSNIYV